MSGLFLSNYAIDSVEPCAKWATLSIAILLCTIGFILFFVKKSVFKSFLKFAGIGFVLYAIIAGIILLVLDIVKHYDSAYLEKNYIHKDIIPYVFVPALITLCLALIGAIALFIIGKKHPDLVKKATAIVGIVCGLSIVTTLILIAIFYTNHIVGDGYYTDGYGELSGTALYFSATTLIIAGTATAFILGRKDKSGFDTRCIVLAGITVALSFTLSYVKLWRMPQGGSITLVSMLPIMLFSYIYGAKKGMLVGLVYGILQSLQNPFIVHPAQFLLDYPIAYALTGLAGGITYTNLFKKTPQLRFATGALTGASLRFVSHVLSGIFAFGAYAKDAGAANVLTYSLVYNIVVLIDVAIVIAVGFFLFVSKGFVKQLNSINPPTISNDK